MSRWENTRDRIIDFCEEEMDGEAYKEEGYTESYVTCEVDGGKLLLKTPKDREEFHYQAVVNTEKGHSVLEEVKMGPSLISNPSGKTKISVWKGKRKGKPYDRIELER